MDKKMENEIKEILEEFKSLFEISEAPEHIIRDFYKLADYISVLEVENKQAKVFMEKVNNDWEEMRKYFNEKQ